MEILGLSYRATEEERNILKRFFEENEELVFNTGFIEYESIKEFGDIYEKFLNDNNLRDNDFLMLFLMEIRYDQIAYKLTENTNHRRMEKLMVPKTRMNSTIAKWYLESKVSEYVNLGSNEQGLKRKIKQNELERQKSKDIASNYLVK
ncbi:MAG: hypothetical protein K6E99_00150 [Bacilli bacterium]|nr:hypothetical protein [Bacilli bacterium]